MKRKLKTRGYTKENKDLITIELVIPKGESSEWYRKVRRELQLQRHNNKKLLYKITGFIQQQN